MAFSPRPDGLIDVDTPMGPMPMAPDVAMQLGWTPGAPEAGVASPPPLAADPMATAQYGGSAQPPKAYADPALAGAMNAADPGQLRPQEPAPTQQAAVQPSGPGPMESLALSMPGGRSSSASSRSGPAPIVGPERQRIEAAQATQLGAAQKAQQANAAIADMVTEQAGAEAAKARQIQQNEAIRQQQMNARIAEMQNKREELRRAVPDEIDQGRWNKMGGGGAVLAAVSIALGGIAQGLTGRDNPGMAVINDLIARDIAAQKDEIALAQDAADTADNDLQRYMDLYGDPLLAEKQLEINDLEAMKKEVQARIQGAQAEQDKALGMQGIAELEEMQARARNEMDGRAQQITTQSQFEGESAAEQQGRIMAGRAADQARNDPYAGMNDASRRDAIGRIVALPDGRQAYATTTADAQATNKLIGARQRYVDNMNKLRKIIKENVGKNISPELRGRMKAIVQENKIALKDTNELGAITASDAELVTPLSGEGILSLMSFDDTTVGALDEAESYVDAQLTHRMGNLYSDPMASPGSKIRSTGNNSLGAQDAGIP